MTAPVSIPGSHARRARHRVAGSSGRTLTLTAAALGAGVGDLALALANARGREGSPGSALIYWVGILLLYLSPTVAALRLKRSDGSGYALLVVLLAVGLFVEKLAATPTRFATVDELQTLRSLNDLVRSHHLFNVNPMVGAYPRFPGSQIAVVTLHELTGLNLSTSGKLLIGVEHIVLCLALFRLVERLVSWPLAAYLAVAVYACNPSYVFFDSETAYEAFALPLAIVVLCLLAVAGESPQRERRALVSLSCVVALAVCVSHHMTSYWLAAMLIGWVLVAATRRRKSGATAENYVPWVPALIITAFATGWFLFVARVQMVHELGPTFSGSISAIRSVLSGAAEAKAPFHSTSRSTDFTDPGLLRLLAFASVVVAMGVLVWGLWESRRAGRLRALIIVTLAFGALYPIGLALRLTSASTETASRTSEFVFVSIGLAAALVVIRIRPQPRSSDTEIHAEPTRYTPRAARDTRVTGLLILTAVAVLAVGGIVTGPAPYDRLAGTELNVADTRSVGLLGEQTSDWASSHWASGSRFFADQTNAILIGSAGDFAPQGGAIHGTSLNYLYTSPTFDREAADVIIGDDIRYVVVDQRLGQTQFGTTVFDISTSDSPKPTAVSVSSAALDKFSTVPQLTRTYDNGVIQVYDTERLLSP